MAKDQREYQRNYYRRNKQSISDKKKERYWAKRSVREGAIRRSREYYSRNVRTPDRGVSTTVKRVGDLLLFSIRHVCNVCDVSPRTIRSWIEKGHIPPTSYTDSRGWNLFTQAQVDALEYAFQQYSSGQWTHLAVRKYLDQHWSKGISD